MITRQIPQVRKFILEFLEFQKFAFDTDYYRLFCFWQILFFIVLFAYFDESMSSKRVYKP